MKKDEEKKNSLFAFWALVALLGERDAHMDHHISTLISREMVMMMTMRKRELALKMPRFFS